MPVSGDIAEASVRRRLIAAAGDLGGLDIVVNNASALGPIRPLMEFDVSRFTAIFEVNATAPLAMMQIAAPLLGGAAAVRTRGQAAAAPPRSVMKSRRRMCPENTCCPMAKA